MNYKIKVSSTIPVVDYGNIIPTIELEGTDYKKLEKLATDKIKDFGTKYAKAPLKDNSLIEKPKGGFRKITTFTEETIMYSDEEHCYMDLKGNKLLSGSVYAKQFAKPFDKARILPLFAKKHNTDPELINTMGQDNSELSLFFGNAIHKMLENYFTYKELSCYTKPKQLLLLNALNTFPLLDTKILPEIAISDVKRKMTGRIDGLVVVGNKEGYIIDYKTDANISKNLNKHFNQLSFYANILQHFGGNITKVEIGNYTDKGASYESEVLEVKI